jgi:two-component system KDP operon response regulator KdpE
MIERVLLIDPSFFIQSQLEPIFRKKGINVYVASSGKDATSLLGKSFPEVIITELSLPDTDGLVYLKNMRQARPNLKYIIIASSIDKNTLTEIISLGIKDVFIKPFSVERLLARITAAS